MPRFKHKAFSAPGYNESAAPSVSPFGLAFDSRTATDLRTELGSWANRSFKLSAGNELDLSGRIGWAHDWQSSSQLSATFAALPTASFVVTGAMPAPDRLLLTDALGWRFRNDWSFLAKFDAEIAASAQTYRGLARLSHTW